MRTNDIAGIVMILVLGVSATSLGAADADLRLIEAAKRSDAAAVRALVKQGLDVNARAGDGATALHWAAYRDQADLVQLLIRSKAAVNATNDLGVTPLWVAASSRGTTTVEALLAAGAKPNLAPPSGETPLMVATRTGNLEAIKLLITHGANVNAKEAARGQTALMRAISDHQPQAARLLIEAGADLRARTAVAKHFVQLCCSEYNGDTRGTAWVDYGGFTPLLFAAREGDVEAAKYLLAAGANVNDVGADGATALAVAALSGQTAVAQLLIEHGADLNAAGGGYAPLHATVLRGDLALAKTLIAHGADVNVRQTKATQARRTHDDYAFDRLMIGATPFMLAAKDGEAAFMRLFAAGGADRSIGRLDDGSPPLVVAARGEQHARNAVTVSIVAGQGVNREPERRALEAIKVVLELGAEVNGADKSGNTAMHIAARKRFESVIRFLAEHGARIDARNDVGETPLALALRPLPPPPGAVVATNGFVLIEEGPRIAEVLRSLGAKE
jgi:ankyrin repeat protein